MIAHAKIAIRGLDETIKTSADPTGHFAFSLPAGLYRLDVESPGFEPLKMNVSIPATGGPVQVRAVMKIASINEEVIVDEDGTAGGTAADNKTAIVFNAQDLKMFSDDNATFQKQILAFAEGGLGSPQIYVNGFSSGHIPPKSSIREVRFNRNPYSALFDKMGLGRVEIVTRAGGDKLHGSFEASGNDIDFNTRNPFYPGAQPPYYSLTLDGNLSGPIGKKSSFFVGGTYNDQQNNAPVNAYILDGTLQKVAYSAAVPDPQTSSIYSLRLDRVFTQNNTFTGSYQFNQVNTTNGSVGLLVLPLEGFNSGATAQTLQLSDSQIIGMKMMTETRFQYIRSRLQQGPASTAATIVAEGSFNGGGNPQQQIVDNQDSYEFQEYFSRQQGSHFLRIGGRYRLYRDSNLSSGNYNGQYLFASLDAYQLTLQNVTTCLLSPAGPACLTPTQLTAAGGGASEYSLTIGKKNAVALTGDLAVFAEDEWKATKNVTFDLGFRFESQSGVPDHVDPAPRIGIAWAVHRKNVKAPFVTLRGGAGVFYDRFNAADLLTSIRQNGVTQQTFFLNNPSFFPNLPVPDVPPTTYTLNPHLRTEYGLYTSGSVERVFGRYGRVGVTYTAIRGDHQYLSRNINAPLPGTYDPTVPGSGTRPLGGTQNIYQFDSSGMLNGQILSVSSRFNLNRRITTYLVYSGVSEKSDAVNADTFVSNSYNVHADYGRVGLPSQDVTTGAIVQLPLGISSNLYFSAKSGVPFNITTGADLNGDSQFNDRPTFATDLSRASVVKTRFGNFDTSPIAGQTLVPVNYGNSPKFVFFNFSLAKGFAVGPRPAVAAATTGGKPGPLPDRPFSLNLSVDAENIFNHVNPGTPVGVLGSNFFGQPISLSTALSTNTAANRLILLQMSFSF
jgi:hypothetical protein